MLRIINLLKYTCYRCILFLNYKKMLKIEEKAAPPTIIIGIIARNLPNQLI